MSSTILITVHKLPSTILITIALKNCYVWSIIVRLKNIISMIVLEQSYGSLKYLSNSRIQDVIFATKKLNIEEKYLLILVSLPVATMIIMNCGGIERTGRRVRQMPTIRWRKVRPLSSSSVDL